MDEVAILSILGLLVMAYLLGAPLYLHWRLRRAERRMAEQDRSPRRAETLSMAELEHALRLTERRVGELERALGSAGSAKAATPEPGAAAEPAPEKEPEAEPEEELEEGTEPEALSPEPLVPEPIPAALADAGPWARTATAEPQAGLPPGRAPQEPRRSVEETLASRWMVWLGGVAVALSAVFLFRYAVDQGWLTPMARVVLGLLLGGALLAAGEWALRRPVPGLGRVMRTDFVPPSLSAAGIFAIYVSLYAAHALFGLLTPATGFVALGLVSYAALGLALRQGWFVAVLGLLAGYLVPLLVNSPDPQALPVFLYLLMLTAGCLALMVWRKWWWFSALTMAGALVWPLLWIADQWTIADQGVIGAYALGVAVLFGALSTELPLGQPDRTVWRWLWALVSNSHGLGFTLFGALLLVLADVAGFNGAAFLLVALYGVIAFGLALWRPQLEGLVMIAAIIALLTLLAWPQPAMISLPEEIERMGTGSAGTAFGPFVLPPEFEVYANALWALAALFGLMGFAGLRRSRTPPVWAGLSAAMPVLLFGIAYWRIAAFEIDVQWAVLAVGLAVAMLAAASLVTRMLGPDRRDAPLALYAAGCTAALALAFACLLREAWLTVAVAAEVLALGWVWSRLRVPQLRPLAAAVVLVVIARLVVNDAVLDYSGTGPGMFGWVIYGYGLPALFIGAASRLFARNGGDLLVTLCEIAAFGLAFLTVALQLKLWTSGNIALQDMTLFDRAVQSVWWLVAAALLLSDRSARFPWANTTGLLVLLAAALQVFFGQVLDGNPLIRGIPVGTWPVVNLLGLAYLAPALLVLAIAGLPGFILPPKLRGTAFAASGVLVFVYITLETRRAFQGSHIALTVETAPSNGELYAYSVVWMIYALAILAAGIRRRSQTLRYASLAVLIVTVAKVFLYDMSDLTGLFRVASFLGLGLALIGIGRVYQKYVFAK